MEDIEYTAPDDRFSKASFDLYDSMEKSLRFVSPILWYREKKTPAERKKERLLKAKLDRFIKKALANQEMFLYLHDNVQLPYGNIIGIPKALCLYSDEDLLEEIKSRMVSDD